MNEDLLIYALGGESLAAPSDTMPAYWGALGAGADGLLVGVQRTSDGVLVCCSQDSLEPTT
ncbi:MAG TPA: glycerophosphodiester phosphodiesterase family protein, partial [Allosphingosinicella sp.]|nr:glycerophosphodiester phosphodiesterase family protein [Allosphingosinicella sp.]